MAKLPSESLLAGRRALDGIPEAKIIQDWQWVESQKSWTLHISLSPVLTPTEFVPARTDWYFVVEDRYPLGSIKLYPAEQGGITATFQHQSLNRANKDLPWRKGDPCLATNFRQLGREGYDYELKGPHDRLRWHVERALEWLIAASKDQVAEPNEPFELPAEHNPGAGTVIFNENINRFEQWSALPGQFGLVALSPVKHLKDAWRVKSFQNISGESLLDSTWGFTFEDTARTDLGMWIRVPRIPVVRPWRYPESWDELRSVLAAQGVDFDKCCRIALANLRDGKAHFCLLGFPIPDRVGGAPRMLCWKAIEFPPLTSPYSKGGFGADPNSLWKRDRELFFTPGKPVRWVEAQNWDKNQIQTRGTFPENITEKKAVLVGVGALGSVLAEMLVRGGVNDLLLVDSDQVKIGNLTRHALTIADIDKPKPSSMAARLNLVSPHAKVKSADSSVESLGEADRKDFLNAEIVWDCSGNDEVFHTLEGMPWTANPSCFSLSFSFGARRLFLYSQKGQFGWEWFAGKLSPWLQKDLEERGDEELPREGIGCWHPVFPALAVDIHLMVSIALKAIATDVGPAPNPNFQVFEQIVENDGAVVGVHLVEK